MTSIVSIFGEKLTTIFHIKINIFQKKCYLPNKRDAEWSELSSDRREQIYYEKCQDPAGTSWWARPLGPCTFCACRGARGVCCLRRRPARRRSRPRPTKYYSDWILELRRKRTIYSKFENIITQKKANFTNRCSCFQRNAEWALTRWDWTNSWRYFQRATRLRRCLPPPHGLALGVVLCGSLFFCLTLFLGWFNNKQTHTRKKTNTYPVFQ
jgi:hypothetical protein